MKKWTLILISLLAISSFITSCALDIPNRRMRPSSYSTESSDPIEETYVIKFERQNECNKGIGLLRNGHIREALTYWQEVGIAYPENSTAFYDVGGAYELMGEFALARDSYIKAIAIKDKQLYRSALERVEGFIRENELYNTRNSPNQPDNPLNDQTK